MKQKEDSKDLLEGQADKPGRPQASRSKLLRVLSGETLSPPPIWLMRQAGRYLSEYRSVRARAGSFMDLCLEPELAAKVTLQPIDRFGFDAAILFADILLIPHGMGQTVSFAEGSGPQLEPIDGLGIEALDVRGAIDMLRPVFETVKRVRSQLDPERALIGFAGSPWTVATYMVAGHGTPDQAPARLMAARDRAAFQRLIDRIVEATALYLIGQLRAGADCIQLFDSWSGALDEEGFERWVIVPTTAIIAKVRKAVPDAKVIGFPKGAGLHLERYIAATGVDAVSIDWTVPLSFAAERLQPQVAVQGNLDPMVLRAGGRVLDEATDRILAGLGRGRFIFNLGHGIVPETPVSNVERLVKRVREGG